MRPTGMSPIRAGLIGLALLAVGVYFAFAQSLPFRDDWQLRATFRDTSTLRVGAPVRIAGVDVGEVTDVHTLGGEQAAVVEMRIDERGLPIHADARLAIRPRMFLEGNFFVELHPGSPSAPKLGEGEMLPVNQTTAPVQTGQVITSLQLDSRRDLQSLVRELGGALDTRSTRALNRSAGWWEEAWRDTALATDAMLGTSEGDLSTFLRHAGTVSAALDRDPERLRELITDFSTTAAAFGRGEADLSAAVAELPAAIRSGRLALTALNSAFPPLRALAADARPGVRAATPALAAATPLERELRALAGPAELLGLARDLRPSVPSLARFARDGVPALRELRPAASCMTEVVLPWSQDTIEDPAFPAIGPLYQELPKSFSGPAGESRSGDANGQWVRTLFSGGNYAYPTSDGNFYLTGRPLLGANPPKPARRPPLRPDVPCETQERPDLRTIPDSPPPGFRVATGSDLAREVRARTREAANKWLGDLLGRTRTGRRLRVSDELLTLQDIRTLGRAR